MTDFFSISLKTHRSKHGLLGSSHCNYSLIETQIVPSLTKGSQRLVLDPFGKIPSGFCFFLNKFLAILCGKFILVGKSISRTLHTRNFWGSIYWIGHCF